MGADARPSRWWVVGVPHGVLATYLMRSAWVLAVAAVLLSGCRGCDKGVAAKTAERTADAAAPAPEPEAPRAVFHPEPKPERPVPFGYKTSWLALPADDGPAAAEALGLEVVPAAWGQGVEGSWRARAIFVTPPMDGWVLVTSYALMDATPEERESLVTRLSQRFGEAQGFVNHRVGDEYGWVLAQNGELKRSIAWSDGHQVARFGEPFGREPPTPGAVDEAHVLAVAAAWSVDPMRLGEVAEPSTGWAAPHPEVSSRLPWLRSAIELFGQVEEVPSGVARSPWEAEEHAMIRKYCQDAVISLPGRVGLPWEPFTQVILQQCGSRKIWLEYVASEDWDESRDPEQGLARSANPSTLLSREHLERIAELSFAGVNNAGDVLPDGHAARGLAALRELEKLEPPAQGPQHEARKAVFRNVLSRQATSGAGPGSKPRADGPRP